MWDALSKKYGILFEMKLRALELKLIKLKCTSNKGMEKHLLALSACFANMKKAGQPYSDERKRITLLNSCLTHRTGKTCTIRACTSLTLTKSVWQLLSLKWNV